MRFTAARRGDVTDAVDRLDACEADDELIAIARDCLAREPEDRPRHAGAVAERVAGYLGGVQDRLRAAEVACAAEEARAEQAIHTAAEANERARSNAVRGGSRSDWRWLCCCSRPRAGSPSHTGCIRAI